MFVYTTNEEVINQLELENCPLVKVQDNGVRIYALSPTSKFVFDKQLNTEITQRLVL